MAKPRTWKERKLLAGNRAEWPVHLTRTGHAKIGVIWGIQHWMWENGELSACGGPQKSRILEHGLDLQLLEQGIKPIDVIRNPDSVLAKKIAELAEKRTED